VRGVIRNFASEDDQLLVLGCGNSRMTEDLAADGYLHIMNIDFSRVVVEQVRCRLPGWSWVGRGFQAC
jgi:2-polyprenyl-3-methyl-5-hydroxy-6-metoxy-1,4-benzoquinol methylase